MGPFGKQENSGEFKVLLSLELGDINLNAESIKYIYFIENIYNYSITGEIIFADKNGILEFGPLTGNETLSISYGINNNIEKTFDIFKVSKVQKSPTANSGTDSLIQLFFTDTTFKDLNIYKISKSWKNKRHSVIIKDIAENVLNITNWDNFEDSLNIQDYFYMPYWTPNTGITWLINRAIGKKSKNSGYLFYTDSLEKSNLVTIDTLFNQKSLLNIDDNDDGVYVFEDPNLFLFNKILDWDIKGIDLTSMKRWVGGTNFGYNTKTKNFLIKENTFLNVLKKHTILGKFSLFPDYNKTNLGFENLNEDTEEKINAIFNNNWNRSYDQQQTFTITVRGHENRFCGKLIHVKWPSKEKINNIYNKNFSGKYLIKSITHYFSGYTKPSYIQKMNLIKNGYEETDMTSLIKAEKYNKV